jgi:hypothetical protein
LQYRRALLVQDGAPLTRGCYIKTSAREPQLVEAGNSLADCSSAYFTLPDPRAPKYQGPCGTSA